MAPVGIALVGGGIFAKTEHMPAILKCDNLSLKAIYSRSLKSAEDTASLYTKGQVDRYSSDSGPGKDYDDVLARKDISAVILALPIVSQPEYIKKALAAGKHVLAEKPLAADVARGKDLIEFYEAISSKHEHDVTFAIAENVRFMPIFTYAAEEAKKLGKVTHFSVKVFGMMKPDAKWVGTEWRRKPEYQGGFLLDGGVHHAAATRLFLQGESEPAVVSALTTLAQQHLPPIDTANAIVKTKAGASGTFQISSGSLMSAFEWDFAFEKGSLKLSGDTVTVKPLDGETTSRDFPRTSGVSEEVAAWAESLVQGTPNPLQSPREALADLEFMEKIFRSGEQDGAPNQYELQ